MNRGRAARGGGDVGRLPLMVYAIVQRASLGHPAFPLSAARSPSFDDVPNSLTLPALPALPALPF